MSRRFDLAVVGGGPAGTSAAITAARLGFDVLLFEAGGFPRHKVCGEFVSGEALTVLRNLLRDDQFFDQAPRIGKARIFLDGLQAALPIVPSAASISRHNLDDALWRSAIASGCNVRKRTRVTSIGKSDDAFMIHFGTEKATARAVINATGRWSNLTKPMPNAEQWIGLKGHFFEPSPSESCDLYFFEGGYCGVQPLGDSLINAAAMVRPRIARSLGAVLAMNPDLEQRARSWKPAIDPVSTAPLFFRPHATSENGVLMAGDAVAFLDPFAGDGISIALHSGRMAAQAVAAFLRGECDLPVAAAEYDLAYRRLIAPTLLNAKRLRSLLHLPRALRSAAVACLRAPWLGRVAVKSTRIRLSKDVTDHRLRI